MQHTIPPFAEDRLPCGEHISNKRQGVLGRGAYCFFVFHFLWIGFNLLEKLNQCIQPIRLQFRIHLHAGQRVKEGRGWRGRFRHLPYFPASIQSGEPTPKKAARTERFEDPSAVFCSWDQSSCLLCAQQRQEFVFACWVWKSGGGESNE